MKRFSETEKWRDPWFRSLKPSQKLLFLFIVDNCNNAGFWEEDKDYACYATGMNVEEYEGAVKGLARGLIGASGWYWVKNFLKHQKNDTINPENRAHVQILKLLAEQSQRFNASECFRGFLAPYKGLLSPLGIGKGKGKGIGKKEGEIQEGKDEKAPPKMDGFEEFWSSYPKKKAKGDAEKAWREKGCFTKLDQILTAIKRARSSPDWKKDNGQFIPHPATWLNRKGWEDDIAIPSRPKQTNGTAVELEVPNLIEEMRLRRKQEEAARSEGCPEGMEWVL